MMTSMSRRQLMIAATGIAAVAASPRIIFTQAAASLPTGPFKVDPLAYPANALEPHIDALTMEIHHDRHHQAYVTNLNNLAHEHPQIAAKPNFSPRSTATSAVSKNCGAISTPMA